MELNLDFKTVLVFPKELLEYIRNIYGGEVKGVNKGTHQVTLEVLSKIFN